MMVHHSPPEPLITVISPQEPSRMSSADTLPKPVTMFLEDSAGTVTDFPSNIKSIRSLKSQTRDKSYKWVLPSTISNAETLS